MSCSDRAITDLQSRGVSLALGLALFWSAGCAGHPGSAGLLPPDAPPLLVADASPFPLVAADATRTQSDDPFDPFAKLGDEEGEEYDPWESLNTKVFEFNRQVDRWVLKPVAQGYDVVVPNSVQIGIANFFSHLRFPPRLFNNLFQGKMKGAGVEIGRFMVNSTLGFAGFVDVAKDLDLTTSEEDLGQTLGFYGVKPGPYLMVPFLPPFTVRDFVGYLGDIALNPINWLVAPIIEVDGVPSAIPHDDRMTTTVVQLGGRVFEILNDRSLNLEKFQGVEEATLDLYTAVRNAYLQKRAQAIKE